MKKEVKRVVKNSVQSDISKLSTLEFLLSDFSILKRVANYFAKNLADLAGKNHIFNLLLTLPTSASQVIFCPKLFDVGDGALVILKLKIETHIKPENRRQPYKIICYTPTGFVSLVFFKTYPGQMEKLVIGREVAVLGHLSKSIRENQIVHPLEIVDISEIDQLPKVNLVYPFSGALTQKFVRAKIVEILRFLDKRFDEEKAQKNDWIDKNLRSQRGWPLFVPALKMIHNFGFEYDDKAQNNALQRLKYDELLAWQIAMILVRRREEKTKIMPQITSDIADEFLKKLPFDPTKSQLKVAMEIKKNILSNKTMLRLLQGDVGSGKTILAIYACLLAYASGKQSCVIVPISILADQHLEYFKRMVVAIAPHPNPLPTSG
ncbi:MAG TPA: DEAD/DEAH box helicase, partial [Rickettsiales bacterium]|nr:DEAD/DEAH box helicase [Rickettsiales bacterium]